MPRHISGNRERLDHYRVFIWNSVRNNPGIFCRYDGILTKASVAMNAQHHQRGTDIGFAHGARIAVSAADHRVNRDALAHAGRVNSLTNGINLTKKFMANHAWVSGQTDYARR